MRSMSIFLHWYMRLKTHHANEITWVSLSLIFFSLSDSMEPRMWFSILDRLSSLILDPARTNDDFKVFTTSFDCLVDDAPNALQMNLMELQCVRDWKHNSILYPLFNFIARWQLLARVSLPRRPRKEDNCHVLQLFLLTIVLENEIPYCKSRLRSQMSDRHISDIFWSVFFIYSNELFISCSIKVIPAVTFNRLY